MSDPDIVTRLRSAEWYCNASEEHMGYCNKKCAKRNLPNPDECHAAADEIERLRNERNAFEAERDELISISNKLKRERDEARRMVCEKEETLGCDERGVPRNGSARDHAKQRGWDCFKEATR